MMLTFLASGLLHEYIFSCQNVVAYTPGLALLFFFLMGLLMLAETVIWNYLPKRFQEAVGLVPSPSISASIALLAAWPFDYFFFQSWLDAGFLKAAAGLLSHLRC